MATDFSEVVGALRDQTGLTDAQLSDAGLARAVRAGMVLAKLHARSFFRDFVVGDLTDNLATGNSTITPALVADGDLWGVLLILSEYAIANQGMLTTGQSNVGATTVPGLSVNQGGRVSQHRENAALIWKMLVEPALRALKVGEPVDTSYVVGDEF